MGDESSMTTADQQIQQDQQQQQQQPITIQPYHIRIEENSKQVPSVTVSVHGDNPEIAEEAIKLYRKVKESLSIKNDQ